MQKNDFASLLVSQRELCGEQRQHTDVSFDGLAFGVGSGTPTLGNFPPECLHAFIYGKTIDKPKFPYLYKGVGGFGG